MTAAPTRRAVLTSTGAVLVAAGAALAPVAAAAPHPAADNPDAALLAVCADFEATERAIFDIYDNPTLVISDDEADALAEPLEATLDRLLDMLDGLPTHTAEGLRARIRLLSVHNGHGGFSWDEPHMMSGRLLGQVMREGGAALAPAAASPAASPDAALITACAEFHRHHAAVLSVASGDDAGLSAANRARWDTAEVVEGIAAVTHAGQAAKSGVALVLLEENSGKCPDGDISLAVSALRDVAKWGSGERAAAIARELASPDAPLLMACADFQLACVEQRRQHVTDAESDALADAFYASLARVEALTPTTPTGMKAKVLAAHSALMDQIHNFIDKDWREEASPEERVVIDTLQHVLDGVAA